MVTSQNTLLSSNSGSGSGGHWASVATADGGSSLAFGPSLLPQLGLDSSTLAAAKTISWRQDPPFTANSTVRQQRRAWSGVTTFELQQQPSGRGKRGVPLSVHNLSEPLALLLPLAPPAISAVSEQEAGTATPGELVSVRCRRGVREQLQVQCQAQDAVLALNVSGVEQQDGPGNHQQCRARRHNIHACTCTNGYNLHRCLATARRRIGSATAVPPRCPCACSGTAPRGPALAAAPWAIRPRARTASATT